MLVTGTTLGVTPSFVAGYVAAQPREDRVDLRARFFDRSAFGQPALDEQPSIAALLEAR